MLILVVLVSSPSMSAAGAAQIRSDMSTETLVIASQLRAAVRLGRLVLRELNGPQVAEGLGDIVGVMYEMYRQIGAAIYGMNLARSTATFQDPLLEYELRRADQAWSEVRWVIDRYGALPTEEYVNAATEKVTEAIGLLEDVLGVMS